MKKTLLAALYILLSATPVCAQPHMGVPQPLDVTMTLSSDKFPMVLLPVRVTATLSLDGHPLNEEKLMEIHNTRLRIFMIDPGLTDYHDIVPEPTATPGTYTFDFTANIRSTYRAWAKITPIVTGEPQYVRADLSPHLPTPLDRTQSLEATVDGYKFYLSFEAPPMVVDNGVATLKITTVSGEPVTSLEPLDGTFADLVAFHESHTAMIHASPMTKEPTGDEDRAGPSLPFQINFDRAGLYKIFAHVRIQGRDIYVPFAISVQNRPQAPGQPAP